MRRGLKLSDPEATCPAPVKAARAAPYEKGTETLYYTAAFGVGHRRARGPL